MFKFISQKLKPIDLIHFHPNEVMSKKFVSPLMENEKRCGIKSLLINSVSGKNYIKYDLDYKNLLILPISLIKLILILKICSPNIIISHNSKSSLLPLLAARLCRIKRIVYFNHGIPYLGHQRLVRLLLFILEKINIFLAKEIITVSEDMLSEFKKITKKKTILIHKGSACGFVIPKKKLYEKNFRVKLGFSKKDFLVAFIGRLEKRKGYNLALKIWKEYFLNQKNIKLLIYGTAMKKKYEKNLKKNVYYMGYTNDIPTVLSNIDCLILPSKHEGFSYVALEAIAYNCPVIATNIPGLRNLLTKDKNSILLKSFSTLDYAKGITEIKKRAIKKITIPKFINKYDRKKFMISYLKFLQAKKH